MPRFRITPHAADLDDTRDAYDALHDQFDEAPAPRRRRDGRQGSPRLVLEGRSGRTPIDADGSRDAGGAGTPRPGRQ